MRKTKKRGKSKIKYVVFAVALALIIIIAVIASLSLHGEQQQPTVTQYFDIEWTSIQANHNRGTSESIIVVYLSFEITPVRGDAHSVFITARAVSKSFEPIYHDVILKDQTIEDVVEFENYIAAVVNGSTVVLPKVIWVGCEEASSEQITFRIPLENVTFLS